MKIKSQFLVLWLFTGGFVTAALRGAVQPFSEQPVALGACRTHFSVGWTELQCTEQRLWGV